MRDLLAGDGFGPLTSLLELAVQAGEATAPGADPDLTAYFTAFDEQFGHLANPLELIEFIGPGTGIYVAQAIWYATFLMPSAAAVAVARDKATAAGQPDLAARIGAVLDVLRSLAATIAALRPAAADDLAKLDGLLAEAIDAASHRIDAWMTSLATARLAAHRAVQPVGLGIGAYGWLEDLRARSPGQRGEGDGWVLAPSQHHAVTAAVLRSGWLAHEDRTAFAVDLSSARVRRARSMLEGVAAGQTISRLLGYQFERALHERELDSLIHNYREVYPLADGGDPTNAVADGEAVRQDRAHIEAAGADVTLLLPTDDNTGQQRQALFAILADLDDAVDAVGDLLLAEGVHQLVGGATERAAGSVDAIARGENPPLDPDVVRTPRRGATVAARLAAVLPSRAGSPWAGPDTGRATLSPETEAWAASLLGPPTSWSATFEVGGVTATITLAELDVAALDVLAEATEPVELSPLAARVAERVVQTHGAAPDEVRVGGADLADLAVLCGHARSVLAGAQPLLPGAFADDVQRGWDVADLALIATRVSTWSAATRAAASSLQTAAGGLRAAMPELADPADRAAFADSARALADLGVTAATGLDSTPDPSGAGAALATQVLAAANDPPPVPVDPARASAVVFRDARRGATAARRLVGTPAALARVGGRRRAERPASTGRPPRGSDSRLGRRAAHSAPGDCGVRRSPDLR